MVAIQWMSLSLTRVYYLSARGTEVQYFGPDSTTGLATKIGITPNDVAGFSVSPDDRRIAVSILSYTPEVNRSRTYVGMRMYVEDLNGGGNHVDIFSSASVAEYPIGWVGRRLIVAVATPWGLTSRPNPYDASEYHIVDPANGDRLASLCDKTGGPVGWIQTFGTMCSGLQGRPVFVRWDGSSFPGPAGAPNTAYQWSVAVSPDGTRAAIAGDPMQVVGAGTVHQLPVGAWNVFGWLDDRHIAYQKPAGRTFSMFDVQSLTDVEFRQPFNTYRGAFPVPVT
jgi:hypothetical protein